MKRYSVANIALRIFILHSVFFNQYASAAATGHKDSLDGLLTGEGLYGPTDEVFILNVTNFKSSVYNSKTGWLVEFYNSWCGFCYRFAPTWKAFGENVKHWRDVVVVAAIDCANDDNNPMCRDYEIMYYPMLKYFHVDAKPGNLGIEIPKGPDVDTVRHNLVERLEKEQQEGRGSSWPNIAPYRSADTKNLWKNLSDSVKYNFLIFEVVESYLATEVTLDLHKIDSIQVRGVTSENEPLAILLAVNKFPTLMALGRNGTRQNINVRYPTREGFRKAIKEFIKQKGIAVDMSDDLDEHPVDLTKVETTEVSHVTDDTKEKKDRDDIKSLGDVVFQLDLETGLRYSLEHEIPMTKDINGDKFNALGSYLNVLAKYFPLRRSGVLFLETLREIIDQRTKLSGEEFRQIVKSTEEEMSPIYSGPKEWIGCRGSVKSLRGYPCGLWTMFHTLTVNAANDNKDNVDYEPQEVLKAMHGYVKYFFGCSDCSQHFQQMAKENKIFQVRTADESILWLWKSHNQVNKRLAGDETEDPEHKKIQYPSKEHCLVCRHSNGTWNEAEVLNYLYRKYSYSGINYYNSSGKPDEDDNIDDLKVRQGRASDRYIVQRRLGWDFTIFDISICVVLYVMSAAILVLVCIKFAMKRTYRKRTYIRDLFTKV